MKRKLGIAALVLATMALVVPASAHRYDRTNDSHWLRWIGYGMNAIGVGLEYAIARPIHAIVSCGDLDIVFGHDAHAMDDGKNFEWVHGDYEPSVKHERAGKNKKSQKMAN